MVLGCCAGEWDAEQEVAAIIPASADGPWQLVVAAGDYDNKVETIEADRHWIVWGQSGDGPGQFPWPPDSMTSDPTSRVVYVSVDNDAYDNEKARIEKFTAKYGPGGRLLGRLACEGQNLGALATDRAGNLFVTDLDPVQAFQAVYPNTTITGGPRAASTGATRSRSSSSPPPNRERPTAVTSTPSPGPRARRRARSCRPHSPAPRPFHVAAATASGGSTCSC
jgi:hypothetical protein